MIPGIPCYNYNRLNAKQFNMLHEKIKKMKAIKEGDVLNNYELGISRVTILERNENHVFCECSNDKKKWFNVGNIHANGEGEKLVLGMVTDPDMWKRSKEEIHGIFLKNCQDRDNRRQRVLDDAENRRQKALNLEKLRIHSRAMKSIRAEALKELTALILDLGSDKAMKDKRVKELVSTVQLCEVLAATEINSL